MTLNIDFVFHTLTHTHNIRTNEMHISVEREAKIKGTLLIHTNQNKKYPVIKCSKMQLYTHMQLGSLNCFPFSQLICVVCFSCVKCFLIRFV